ncbi:MAG TPA: dihydrofolate reductase family protein [Gaiellaceae bacterium]
MSRLRYSTSMSLDGFVAGADQSVDHPLGVGGHLLHEWMRSLAVWRRAAGLDGGEVNASTAVLEESDLGVGALLMGRNMFGGGPGPWGSDPWRGWWGDDPPFHLPVFVLTHHARPRLDLSGGTSFTFVTEGIGVALDLARDAAGGLQVDIAGGAGVAKQYLAAGLLDELELHLVPVLLGGGVRLFDNVAAPPPRFEPVRVVDAPGVTHLTYRIARDPAA